MRIVVGVDGSPGARTALEWGIAEARSRSCGLTAVLAYGFYGRPSEVQQAATGFGLDELEQAAHDVLAKCTPDLPVWDEEALFQREVSAEEPVKALLDAVTSHDILVVGARGLGAMRRFLLGSVSSHCVRHAHSAVVVVRPHPAVAASGRVVVGVDGSLESVSALRWAAEHAQARGFGLEVVQAWSVLSGPSARFAEILSAPEAREEATAELRRMVEDHVPSQLRAATTVQLVDGPAAEVLMNAAEGAELLVLGSRGLGGFTRLSLGSTSSACSIHASSNVAVIPGGSRAAAQS